MKKIFQSSMLCCEHSLEESERRTTDSPTFRLRCFDDAKRGSILHAAAGILEFRFAVYF